MPELSTLIAFIGAVAVLNLTPGPDMMLLISRGLGEGWKASLFTALGFTVAGVVQIPALALGVATLVQSSPLAFDILRYAGAVYLTWRGVQLIRKAGQLSPTMLVTGRTSPVLALRDGMVSSLTNPKILLFLLAFLPQFVDPARGSVTTQLVVLGIVMKAVALVIAGSVAMATGMVGRALSRWPRFTLWQERVTGVVLIGLGVRLLTMDGRARV